MLAISEVKGNSRKVSDMGVGLDSVSSEDSFERCLSKELKLEDDELPCFIHEMNDSALNYIA